MVRLTRALILYGAIATTGFGMFAKTSSGASPTTVICRPISGGVGTFKVRPKQCSFFDGDTTYIALTRMKWSHWGRPVATGRGRWSFHGDEGSAKLRLSKRVKCDAGPRYENLTVIYPNRHRDSYFLETCT